MLLNLIDVLPTLDLVSLQIEFVDFNYHGFTNDIIDAVGKNYSLETFELEDDGIDCLSGQEKMRVDEYLKRNGMINNMTKYINEKSGTIGHDGATKLATTFTGFLDNILSM